MFREDGGRPNDERGFIHKRILGGIAGVAKGFISGGPGGAIRGGVTGFVRQPTRKTQPRTQTARPTVFSGQQKEFGRELKFPEFSGPGQTGVGRIIGGGFRRAPRPFTTISTVRPTSLVPLAAKAARDCPAGTVPDPQGADFCVSPESGFGRSRGAGAAVGDAVMGQFGAALEPGVQMIERSVCLPGMQLAKDGLCYNKGAITNTQRMWPRGRRPLLTGGDMRAIGVAARAGAKLDRTTKRLRALGMMKALPKGRGSIRAKPHPALLVESSVSH